MKIYREKTSYSPAIDSEYIASEYQQYGVKLAQMLGKLNDMKDHISYLSEITGDNGDVSYGLDKVISELGIALASCITYSDEYSKEAEEADRESDDIDEE